MMRQNKQLHNAGVLILNAAYNAVIIVAPAC